LRQSVVAGCDAPEVLQPVECTLDRPLRLYRRLPKLNGCFLLQRFGMTGLVPLSSSSRNSVPSWVSSPSIRFDGTLRISRSATGQSCASPPVDRKARRRPLSICECVNRRVAPSARAANSLLLLPPFSASCRAVRFHVRGVDHLRVCGSSFPSKLREQVFPDATPRPAHQAIVDRRRTILGRAIGPATAAFQHMRAAADDAAGYGIFATLGQNHKCLPRILGHERLSIFQILGNRR
jgi:hypothetical protein